MGETLKKWLRRRLGVMMDLSPEIFGYYSKDGTLIAKILHNYDVIDCNQLDTIVRTSDPALCRVNLKHLRVWLRFIGVDCNDEVLRDISIGRGCTSLQLLYKIYIALENKDRLHFITLEKQREKFIPTSTKFKVVTVPEEVAPRSSTDDDRLTILSKGAGTIQWYRDTFENIIHSHKEESDKFYSTRKEFPTSSESLIPVENHLDHFTRTHRVKTSTTEDYDTLCLDEEFKKELQPCYKANPKIADDYRKWLELRKKRLGKSLSNGIEKRNALLAELWQTSIESQERRFDEFLGKKVLNESRYEKKIIKQLCDIRKEKEKIVRNRKMYEDTLNQVKEGTMRLKIRYDKGMKIVNVNDELVEFEYRRMKELRQRMGDEYTTELKVQKIHICEEILSHLFDIAMKLVWYREISESEILHESLWKEMKTLFLKSQPIFRSNEDLEILNHADFQSYLKLDSQENRDNLKFGENVLGYIVHRLISIHSNLIEEPVVLPEVQISAILLGMPKMYHDPLQYLLKRYRIPLIRMEDAINYCLTRYKEEIKNTGHIDLSLIKVTEETIKNLKSRHSGIERDMKIDEPIKQLKLSKIENYDERNKETQTPRDVPHDDLDPILSNTAYIGKWAFDFLTIGQPISDHLATRILLEYLKSFVNVKGWILVNYPYNYRQVQLLENTLSGQLTSNVNDSTYFENVDIDDKNVSFPRIVFQDECEQHCHKQSRLLPNPIVKEEKDDSAFTSSFTLYVKLIAREKQITDEVRTEVDRFYARQNVAHEFYYTHLDSETLKTLVELIISNNGVLDSYHDSSPDNLEHDPIFHDPPTVKRLNELDDSMEEFEETMDHSSDFGISSTPRPGENHWKWINLPLSPTLLNNLANLWEGLEDNYVDSVKTVFRIKRIHRSNVISYKSYIIDNMKTFIERPDTKQDILYNFHRSFNEVHADIRHDTQVKIELYCRIDDLRKKIWDVCDTRKKQAERELGQIVQQNPAYVEAVVLINAYLGLVQAEVDRFLDTSQLVQDYYISMTRKPLQRIPFSKLQLNFVELDEDKAAEGDWEINESAPILHNINLNIEINNFSITDHDETSIDLQNNYCYTFIVQNIRFAEDYVENVSTEVLNVLKKQDTVNQQEKLIQTSDKKNRLGQEWYSAANYEINRVRERLTMLKNTALTDVDYLFKTIRETFQRVRQMIVTRYKNEMKSVNDVVNIFCYAIEEGKSIQEELLLDGHDFIIRSNILMYPDKEIQISPINEKIERLEFQIVQLARLLGIFKRIAPNDYISERGLAYILQDMIACNDEDDRSQYLPRAWRQLKPAQLTIFIQRLFGHSEYIDWREFIIHAMNLPTPTQKEILKARKSLSKRSIRDFIDLVTCVEFHSVIFWFCEENLSIEVMNTLHENLKEEFENKGGEIDVHDWINCLNLKINNENLMENVSGERTMRMILAKELLCHMYSIDGNTVNYTAFLLAFCKDDDPKEGFGKALSLAMGDQVCTSIEEGENYVSRLIALRSTSGDTLNESQKTVEFVIKCVLCCVYQEIGLESQQELNGLKELVVTLVTKNPENMIFNDEEEFDRSSTSSSMDFGIKSNIHWIPREICLALLSVMLPRHAMEPDLFDTGKSLFQIIQTIYQDLEEVELTDEVDMILSHRLLNHDLMSQILTRSSSFMVKRVDQLLEEILQENIS